MNILCLMNFCNNKKENYDLPLPFQNISLNFIFTLLENSPTIFFEFTYMSSYKKLLIQQTLKQRHEQFKENIRGYRRL